MLDQYISHFNGESEIFFDSEKSGLASLYKRNLDAFHMSLDQSELIKVRRLDEYIKEQGVTHINFIKIDIEGHELHAINSLGDYLNNDFVDFIQFEYGGANLDSHSSLMELYQVFTHAGFKVAKVMPDGLEIREYKPFMDNFSYSNYVAISEKILR